MQTYWTDVGPDLLAVSCSENVNRVEGLTLTETCLNSCSSVRASTFRNSGLLKTQAENEL